MIYTSDLEKLEFIHSALMEARNSPEPNESKIEAALIYTEDLQQPYFRSHEYAANKDKTSAALVNDLGRKAIKNKITELFNFKQEFK